MSESSGEDKRLAPRTHKRRWPERLLPFTVIVSLTAILPKPSRSAEPSREPGEAVDQIVQSYHREGRFSGAALVAVGGRVAYRKAVGLADETWSLPNTTDTFKSVR